MTGRQELTLFLCGDAMTGRGVDQILPYPSRPSLREPVVRSALEYVVLAERANGPIPRPVEYDYVWGAALEALNRERPDVRIINLETSVTTSNDLQPKGINYRMHPRNVPSLAVAGIDCCVLANNHVLDLGQRGLIETVNTLEAAGIHVAGAGSGLRAAEAPAVLEAGDGGRALVFAFAFRDSGVPPEWAATDTTPGVHLLADFSEPSVARIARLVEGLKRPGDVAVASVHWGSNWGFDIPPEHRQFARGLVDRAAIDVVHGHSSHHPKAIEVYRDRMILYGCGDFLNDYEGIRRYEPYRHDLVLMYICTIDRVTGRLLRLGLTPFQIRNFRLQHPSRADRHWLLDTLGREYRRFGGRIAAGDGGWTFEWQAA